MPAKRRSRVKSSSRIKVHASKRANKIEYDTWMYEPTKDAPKFVRYRKIGNVVHKDEVMFHPGHGKQSVHQAPHIQVNIGMHKQVTRSNIEKGTKKNTERVRKVKPLLKRVDDLAKHAERYAN